MASVDVRVRDPLRSYQFTVFVAGTGVDPRQGQLIAGVQRVSGLACTVTASEVWEGGNNLHRYVNPDKINWEPVTLEQGLALDDSLEAWAAEVRNFVARGSGNQVKRNVDIELRDPLATDQWMRRYRIKNAWISKYNALPKLDALTSEVALLSVELQHEGWTVEFPSSPI
ncbi:Hypothetical protein A7982_01048 [Minicystis rosea]|nr:Hypothetical protein A7982_01048 [Minicystis rosea]